MGIQVQFRLLALPVTPVRLKKLSESITTVWAAETDRGLRIITRARPSRADALSCRLRARNLCGRADTCSGVIIDAHMRLPVPEVVLAGIPTVDGELLTCKGPCAMSLLWDYSPV